MHVTKHFLGELLGPNEILVVKIRSPTKRDFRIPNEVLMIEETAGELLCGCFFFVPFGFSKWDIFNTNLRIDRFHQRELNAILANSHTFWVRSCDVNQSKPYGYSKKHII